ncbi:MAG: phytoene/squalene synthase family protein [Polyangiaceae bacterium]
MTLAGGDAAALATDLSRCHTSLAAHGKSFHLASALLDERTRDDAAALYAFCRYVDDAVDLAPPAQSTSALQRVRREVEDLYAGQACTRPALREFQRVAFQRGVPAEYVVELLAGMQMDVVGMRYDTFEDLQQYCFRVAGTVGLMMCHVLGVKQDQALRPAAQLGMAMQLTNICRDVREDWDRGRLYLPLRLLEAQGADVASYQPGAEFPIQDRAAFALALQELLKEAQRLYHLGKAGLRFLDLRPALAIHAAADIYADIGRSLEHIDYDVLAGRRVVTRWRKLALLTRAVALEACSIPRRVLEAGATQIPVSVARYPDDILC